MSKSTFRVVALKSIKANFFVRKSINQDHVLMLAELYEAAMIESNKDQVASSKAIEAIIITESNEMVDGRHRKEAMELAGIQEARVEVVGDLKPSELVVEAAKANYGGALPPSREDMVYTVEQLLGRFGLTHKEIEDRLSMLPKSVIRKYINTANRRSTEAKLRLALSDIANGSSLAGAARAHDVKPEVLKAAIEGKKPKTKVGTAQINNQLSTYAKGFSVQVSRVIHRVIEDYRDGEIPVEAAQSAVNQVGHLIRRMLVRAQDWDNRLRAMKAGGTDPGYDAALSKHITDITKSAAARLPKQDGK